MGDISIDRVVPILDESRRRWMTAGEIAENLPDEVSSQQIEELLIKYCGDCFNAGISPLIRYSSLPSRKTLEILWGLVTKVGCRKLSNITKDDVADESLNIDEYGKHADVFISHSHLDYVDVMKVAAHLLQADIVPWLAETHIQFGDHINDSIIDALNTTDVFLLFLSSNALSSRWTGKEYLSAKNKGLPIFVVGSVDDGDVSEMLRAIAVRDSVECSRILSQYGDGGNFLQELITDNTIKESFGFSNQQTTFDEEVRPYDELPAAIRAYRPNSETTSPAAS